MNVNNVREYFKAELAAQRFTRDRLGSKTIELIGASFIADEPFIFGVPNDEYIERELVWYHKQSTNINDIYGQERDSPAAWKYAANKYGEINSNYGLLIHSKKYYNQYWMALGEIIKNPDSRRATMVYNRPSIHHEYNENGKSDFICTNAVTYYIRDDIMHCVVQMRSNDSVFGYKNDYAWQKYVLESMVSDYNRARENEKLVSGNIHWQVQNLHVYEKHFEMVK